MKSLAHLAQQFSRPRVWLDVLLLAALYALASRWPVLKIVAIVASIDLLSFVLFHLFAQQRGMAIQGFLGGLVSSTATFVQLLNSERYKGQSTALLSRTLLYALCAMLLECMLILATLAPTAPWHFYLPFAVSLSGFYGLTWLPQLNPNSNGRIQRSPKYCRYFC